eukprot:gene9858-2049_t
MSAATPTKSRTHARRYTGIEAGSGVMTNRTRRNQTRAPLVQTPAAHPARPHRHRDKKDPLPACPACITPTSITLWTAFGAGAGAGAAVTASKSGASGFRTPSSFRSGD